MLIEAIEREPEALIIVPQVEAIGKVPHALLSYNATTFYNKYKYRSLTTGTH